MRSFAVLSAAGLAAAQVTSIVITDGITATLTLPVFPDPTPSETVTATVPQTTVTVAPEPETPTVSPTTTVTVSVGTSTVLSGLTTTTVIVAPPVPLPTLTGTEDATITLDPITTITEATPVIPPTANSETAFYISQSYGPKEKNLYANMLVKKATFATSTATVTVSPNATTSGPVTVPTAAADRVALKSSVAGLIAFGVASLFLF
ncbi:hypothetical protein CSOJ01_02237 [Colletotrichum sojae]|uniref:Uncharacterized protein n=1 Tax=Colletotrichum sojae TaxID=2175907 RepID=A0A8H6JS43_9PEZI|nr:hypothetical protein CSOJ01_02237 [Colletotrichum sojae]